MEDFKDFGPLEAWLTAPAQTLSSLQAGETAIDAEHLNLATSQHGAPLFRADSMHAALCAADGRVLARTPRFDMAPHAEMLASVAASRTPRAVSAVTKAGLPSIRVYAPAADTTDWHLPTQLRQAMAAPFAPDAIVVMSSEGVVGGNPLRDAARAFGFSGLETRVVIATVETGSIRAAASRLDLAYQTAREAVASGMRRAGVIRLPALVTLLAEVAFGVLPDGLDDTSLLADAWGISPRQAMLGTLVAAGLERGEAAAALGLSDSVAKKEIDRLYQALGVGTAAAMARLLAEANAMQWMMQATAGSIGAFDTARKPLRFALRPDGSRVAFSDYGPASGRPVLVVHSSMTTRFVSRRLVKALQARGFRPMAIDRPGFGLSDPMAGLLAGLHNPFAAAADDVALVAAEARVRRFDVVSRGAAHHLLALGRTCPQLLGRVIITNPDPDSHSDPRRTGVIGAFKESYLRRPGIVRTMARIICTQLSEAKFPALLARTLEGSPPDAAAMAHPDIVEDYWRSVRPFATGRIEGYVNEQMNHATMPPAEPLPGTRNWHFMVAGHDVLYDPAVVLEYWQRTLPDASNEIVHEAGRLMAMTHADLVAERLAGSP